MTGVPEEITNVLREMYAEKGRDFTFKCKTVAKQMNCKGQKIARNLSFLERDGMITKKGKATKIIIWKTCFERRNNNASNM